MSIFFISDLHLGHKSILNFSPNRGGHNIYEHDEWVIDSINSLVGKRDVLYILGDLVFDREKLPFLGRIKGQKFFVLGNHDKFPVEEYMKYGTVRSGIYKYKGLWLTHCPIHPAELRDKKNVHGHVHNNSLEDRMYVNVCVEALHGRPISLEQVRDR